MHDEIDLLSWLTSASNEVNVTIWVKWEPNLASFAAAFYSLRTHAEQGPNLRPLPLASSKPGANFGLPEVSFGCFHTQ